jgi:hypothetical protein
MKLIEKLNAKINYEYLEGKHGIALITPFGFGMGPKGLISPGFFMKWRIILYNLFTWYKIKGKFRKDFLPIEGMLGHTMESLYTWREQDAFAGNLFYEIAEMDEIKNLKPVEIYKKLKNEEVKFEKPFPKRIWDIYEGIGGETFKGFIEYVYKHLRKNYIPD